MWALENNRFPHRANDLPSHAFEQIYNTSHEFPFVVHSSVQSRVVDFSQMVLALKSLTWQVSIVVRNVADFARPLMSLFTQQPA